MIHFECPQCAGKFKTESKSAGKKTKCPKCYATIVVPNVELSSSMGEQSSKSDFSSTQTTANQHESLSDLTLGTAMHNDKEQVIETSETIQDQSLRTTQFPLTSIVLVLAAIILGMVVLFLTTRYSEDRSASGVPNRRLAYGTTNFIWSVLNEIPNPRGGISSVRHLRSSQPNVDSDAHYFQVEFWLSHNYANVKGENKIRELGIMSDFVGRDPAYVDNPVLQVVVDSHVVEAVAMQVPNITLTTIGDSVSGFPQGWIVYPSPHAWPYSFYYPVSRTAKIAIVTLWGSDGRTRKYTKKLSDRTGDLPPPDPE